MLFFALFTLGYFVGVITALFVFPPRTNELIQQEEDALEPLFGVVDSVAEKKELSQAPIFDNPAVSY